jgi:iron complex outermembrane receptor protein
MTYLNRLRASASVFAVFAAIAPVAAFAEDPAPPSTTTQDILVVAQKQTQNIENAPTSRATITADEIATTVNAINVEDALKYLPSLVIRKRHIGDTQAPIATRTSGLGTSARSLIYADGALLSSLIGNNNTSASPRWGMVSAEEIARIDVLYGPFSAAYAGNSIGAVVNITTRLADKLEGTLTAGTSVQTFDQYVTHRTLPAYQLGATLGDRFGPLALFGSITHTISNSQPLTYVAGTRGTVAGATAVPTNGGFDDVNRTNQPIRVFGASGFEHQVQDNIKLKSALDLSSSLRLTYVGGLFLNNTDSKVETYLTDTASGLPTYISPATTPPKQLNIGGLGYTVPASAFDAGVYSYDERHWSHALSATGHGGRFDWQVIGTIYDFSKDVQRTPTTALPAAYAGGAGTITRLDGTGWKTFDAKGAWRSNDAATNTFSAGVHWDQYEVNSNRYATTDWIAGSEGALSLASRGKTRTAAIWAQDALKIAEPLTLTVGGRYEWWRAFDGFNFSTSPVLVPVNPVYQPTRTAKGFSPKVSLAYVPAPNWTVRASIGKAYRFPTVGELYQVVTSPVVSLPDPNLRPERALSEELAIEYHDRGGQIRLSLFNEVVNDALISQVGPLAVAPAQTGTFVQNVDRTRARGVELAVQSSDVVRRVDVSGSVTYTDAITSKDVIFPAAVGKLLPSVPHWKATGVVTWRPTDAIALTSAVRYASRNYGSLDNSDIVGNTYQGFYKYFVVDLRAAFRIAMHYTFAVGVDNVNNDKYFLFHPFPQRTFHADVTVKL